MNIALVILHADPSRGGAERYAVDLAHALAQRGHRVSMLASSFAEVREPVLRVSLPASGATRLGRYLCFLGALDAHLAGTNYDVVHAMLPVRRCDLYHPHAGLAAESVAAGHLKHAGKVSRELSRWANGLNRKRQRFAAVERALLTGRGGSLDSGLVPSPGTPGEGRAGAFANPRADPHPNPPPEYRERGTRTPCG